MTRLSSRRWNIALCGFVFLTVTSACLFLTPVPTGETPAASGDSTGPGDGSVLVEGEVAFGPGTFDLAEPAVGLPDLSSYTATLSLSFDGTQAGQSSQWSRTYIMLASQEPTARQLTIAKTGDVSEPDPVFMAEMDGAAYERLGENSCTATVIDPENPLGAQMEPAGFLPAVIGADAAGGETVDGVATDHYSFDESALGLLGIAESTGEMWVASNGGYIVKYVLTTVGDANYFGDETVGTLTLDYELTGVNQPVAFELPADCPGGMVNAPQLPDASNFLNVPGVLSYDTASNLADAAAFYQAQMPGLGWTLQGEPTLTETMALLDFVQGDQALTVMISIGEGGTTVHILLDRSRE